MKKAFVFAFLVFAVVLCSACSKTPAGDPGDPDLSILATVMRYDSGIMGTQLMSYEVVLSKFSTGAPVTGAQVSVTGPKGTTTLPETLSGSYKVYSAGAAAGDDYVFNSDYTVNVTVGSQSYSAAAKAPGSVDIAADGSSLSWVYDGNLRSISVTPPSGTPISVPAGAGTYADLAGAGVYSEGAGNYAIIASISNYKLFAFTGSHTTSYLNVAYTIDKIQSH